MTKKHNRKNATAPAQNIHPFPAPNPAAESAETTGFDVRIPLWIEAHGRRSDSEMRKIAACDLQNKAGILFRLVARLSDYAVAGDLNETDYMDFCGTLAELGFGIMQAADLIELKRGRGREEEAER